VMKVEVLQNVMPFEKISTQGMPEMLVVIVDERFECEKPGIEAEIATIKLARAITKANMLGGLGFGQCHGFNLR